MASKLMDFFDKVPGFVSIDEESPFAKGVRSPSPSVNFIFGNTHLLPEGASAIFWGAPKGGKTLLANLCAGQLHQDDPEAIVLKFDSELREKFQMTPRAMKMLKIDPNRYRTRMTNKPEEIFDFIENDVPVLCQKGMKIKLIIIDSVTDILGRRALNTNTVNTQQRGDSALTIQTGLQRIKDVLRRYNISAILVAQERAEQDELQLRRGKKVKMAGSYYLRHFAEYFVYVSQNENKDGRTTIMGQTFQDASVEDVDGNAETVAFKIKVQMKDSTVGIAKRVGEFTFHKYLGLINKHEEVFKLGLARHIVEQPNNRSYVLSNWPSEGEQTKWTSKEDCLSALKDNEMVSEEILTRVRKKDIELFNNGMEDQDFIAADSGVDEEAESSDEAQD